MALWWKEAWNGEAEIKFIQEGFFILECASEQTKQAILEKKGLMFEGMGFHLMQWKQNFRPQEYIPDKILVWISLLNLPLELWCEPALLCIGDALGKIVKVDEAALCSSNNGMMNIYVELAPWNSIKETLELIHVGGRFYQKVIWKFSEEQN